VHDVARRDALHQRELRADRVGRNIRPQRMQPVRVERGARPQVAA
jgi:hypothetical protein